MKQVKLKLHTHTKLNEISESRKARNEFVVNIQDIVEQAVNEYHKREKSKHGSTFPKV